MTPELKNNLITDKASQRARIDAKRSTVLAWLAGEGYTTPGMLGEVLGLQRNAVYKTIEAMQRDGLVARDEVHWLGAKVRLITLTPHGAAMAAEPGEEVWAYETGRVAPSTIAHTMAVQQARLQAKKAGWTEWTPDRQCHRLAGADAWLKVPDAVVKSPAGDLVAIELERTIKTKKRYEAIMAAYLQMVRKGTVARVLYLCPDPKVTPRVQAIFRGIESVPVGGQRVPLTEQHQARFSFFNLEGWPHG
jgi:DNA-binding MarR family transcriptional regulator